jgi:serine protease inhibitor
MKRFLAMIVCVALCAACCGRCAAGEGLTMNASTELVRGNNAFALDLYGRVAHGDGNRFLSPFSISCALAMTYGGARGDTAAQMAKTLHFKLPPAELHPAFHHLIAELNHQNNSGSDPKAARAVELLTANALWTQSGERILPEFKKLIEKDYEGGLFPLDFREAPAAACEYINHWVEEQTRGKIKDLIKPQQIDARTVLILTNAIYFKALWANPFKAQLTRPGDFQVSAGEKVQAQMMHHSDKFRYAEDSTAQILELPYQGGNLSTVVVLPKAGVGLTPLESSLSLAKLDGWVNLLSQRRVEVFLPRFKLTAECELKDALSSLGMPAAFTGGDADFSGMNGSRDLVISAVVHKAFVEVDEKGTEAAAATGVVMSRVSVALPPPVVFRADHPFLFLIRDIRNGSILFIGRLVRP